MFFKEIRLISSKKEMPVTPDSVASFAICWGHYSNEPT